MQAVSLLETATHRGGLPLLICASSKNCQGSCQNTEPCCSLISRTWATLLNSDWGRVERTRYEYERDVVSASIVDGQYEYFRLNNTRSIENLETLSRSVWQVQLGIKYDF